jgi:23S rRNA (adenine2030-N6)-methyltransferase
MNYRHAFHAGNFADVLKHVVLVLCLEHLKKKSAPFRVLDTHAGAGRYRLGVGDSARTSEWLGGIGRLIGPDAAPLPPTVARILAPYLETIRDAQPDSGHFTAYPGSPVIAAARLRPADRLVANELHPEDGKSLSAEFDRDRRVTVTALDGYTSLKAHLPPPERRGLILVDPPFEVGGEFIRMTEGLGEALARFRTGTFLLWYPIKDPKPVERFHRRIAEVASRYQVETVLAAELLLRRPRNPDLLNGCGLVVANPPFTLAADLGQVLPELARRCADGMGASGRVQPLDLLP